MAQTVTIAGQEFKKRNIVGVWLGLPIITLGVYVFVWIYKINNEARRFLRDDSIRPGMSLLAFFPGLLLIVPPYVAVYRLGKRIRRMEEAVQMQSRCEPVLGLVFAFLYGAYHLYYQSHLNDIWDRYLQAPAAPSQPIAPPPPIATAPPQLSPPQNVPPPPPPG